LKQSKRKKKVIEWKTDEKKTQVMRHVLHGELGRRTKGGGVDGRSGTGDNQKGSN